MSLHNLLIWGAGGHGKVVLDVARSTGRFEEIRFLDESPALAGYSFCNCALVGGAAELYRFAGTSFLIAIGDNGVRARCFMQACESALVPAVLVHSTAVIAPSARLGGGTVVMPGAVVNAGAVVGRNCIINTSAIIEHDCRIADHVHISPRSVLGGNVVVEEYAHIGIGAVVLPGAVIGEGAVVGAGAVVLKSAPSHSTSVGVPARVIKITQ